MPTLTFKYSKVGKPDQKFDLPAGAGVLACAVDHGVELDHACGGNCACTTCLVVVESGAANLNPMSEDERGLLEASSKLTPTSRLGCQCRIQSGDVILRIP